MGRDPSRGDRRYYESALNRARLFGIQRFARQIAGHRERKERKRKKKGEKKGMSKREPRLEARKPPCELRIYDGVKTTMATDQISRITRNERVRLSVASISSCLLGIVV